MSEIAPPPRSDWVCQADLARILNVSERTASVWAAAGKLRRFEHGFPECGRRRYSKELIHRELERRWKEAVERNEDMKANQPTEQVVNDVP